MDNEQLKAVRRANLARAIDMYLEGGRSECARLYNPDDPKPQQITDLINNEKRSFGEKVARKLEEAIGLVRGELDVPDGPLILQPNRRRPELAKPVDLVKDLTDNERAKVLDFISSLKKRRRKTG